MQRPTPFTAVGALNERALHSVLRRITIRAHGVLVNGTTGELFSETEAERRRTAIEEFGGKIPVVIGLHHLHAVTNNAREIGADEIYADLRLSDHPANEPRR